jgi:hypothetical protein
LNAKLSSTPPGSSGQFIYNNAGAFGAKAIADGDLPSTLADKTLTGPLITASLVANLPSAASNPAKLYVVIDGTAVGDCTTGGGSAATLCRSNGSAWVAFGDGVGSGSGLADPGGNGVVVRTSSGVTTNRTITASTGIVVTNGDGVSGNPTVANDTAVMLTRAQNQAGTDLDCKPASGTNTLTCTMSPALSAQGEGTTIKLIPFANNTGAVTLDAGPGAMAVETGLSAALSADDLAAGAPVWLRSTGTEWRIIGPAPSVVKIVPMTKAVTVESPTASEDITLFYTDEAITITQMNAVIAGTGTPSVTWTVRHNSDRTATGAEVVTSGTATTSQTTGSEVTSFNDATIPADSWVWLETTAMTTATMLNVTIKYTRD